MKNSFTHIATNWIIIINLLQMSERIGIHSSDSAFRLSCRMVNASKKRIRNAVHSRVVFLFPSLHRFICISINCAATGTYRWDVLARTMKLGKFAYCIWEQPRMHAHMKKRMYGVYESWLHIYAQRANWFRPNATHCLFPSIDSIAHKKSMLDLLLLPVRRYSALRSRSTYHK